MRSLKVLLRWSAVLAPVALTVTWVRATSAHPPEPRFEAGFAKVAQHVEAQLEPIPAPMLEVVEPGPAELPEAPPPPAADPCGLEPPPERTDRIVAEVFMGPSSSHAVALTFDDGPSRVHTPRILEILARHEVHATFFALGNRAEKMPDVLAAVDAAGHEIGNHSFSHPSIKSLWKTQIRDEVCRTQDAIEAATGKRPALFRPPFGRYAPSAVGLLGGLGYDIVLWDTDAEDWRFDDPAAMAQHVIKTAHSGSIILLHDSEAITARALPAILEGLKRKGLAIVPVSELTSLTPYQPVLTDPAPRRAPAPAPHPPR